MHFIHQYIRTRFLFAGIFTMMAATSDGQALAVTSPPIPSPTQDRTSPRPANAAPVVTLTLNNVSRDSAIHAVVEAAGYELVYSRQFVKLTGQVSARFSSTPLLEAVTTVLRGSGVTSKISMTSKSVFLAPDTTQKRDSTTPVKPARLKGRVIDSASKRGIEAATVELLGTPKAFITDADGQFFIGELAAGEYVLTARRLGFTSVRFPVTLAAGEDLAVVLQLRPTSTTLTAVVTTGSGDRQKYQVGNSTANIDASDVVANQAIRNLSDLLANRAPGLQVLKGTGSVGSPSRLRIRGISSLEASNAPIILLDGVRISSDYTRCRAGASLPNCNASPSRLDDIDPDIIESIEVLKGPAASTLFGSDAANGVIVIKTKRGMAGPTRWNIRADRGLTYQPTDYPVPLQRLGYPLTGGKSTTCSLQEEAAGSCVPIDSVIGMNLLKNPATTSLARGGNTSLNLDVSGGVPTLQYFLSAGYTNELGTAKLPGINERLIREARGGNSLPEWMKRPNEQTNKSVGGRLTGQFAKTSDFSLGVNFVQLYNRNGADGMSGILTDARSPGDSIRIVPGWETFNFQRTQDVTRVLGNASSNWRPRDWLSGNLTYGWDFSLQDARDLNRRNSCLPLCTADDQVSNGSIYTDRTTLNERSLNLGATVNTPIGGRYSLRSAIGGQYRHNRSRAAYATSTNLMEGATSIEGSIGAATAEADGGEFAIAGVYLDESFALSDRLFLGVAMRQDASSALGSSVTPLYPKWNISWLASQEPFFPWKDRVSLRLRGAFGHAGVQPDGSVKLRGFSRPNDYVNDDGSSDGNYAIISQIGNLDLLPERSIEHEGGFELGFMQDRILLDMTIFRKFTRDAIVSRPLAPSIAFGEQSQNIGNVLNTGAEATLSARVLERAAVSWNLTLNYATRRNKLVELGRGVDPFSVGDFEAADAGRVVEGYPLFGRWARPVVGYQDVNGDGIIAPNEVRVSDSLVYIGSSSAKYDLGILNNFGFLQDRLRISANLQYVNGLVQLNQFRSGNWRQLALVQVPGGSLREQAYVIASTSRPNNTNFGFFENTDFLRFSELSMSYTVPGEFARRLRANSATVSLLATNLGIWTNYNGRDPDVNTADPAGNQYFNGTAFPQARSWAFRVNLSF